jgi:pimeloyl-ACP methyl ester carboxylesterase
VGVGSPAPTATTLTPVGRVLRWLLAAVLVLLAIVTIAAIAVDASPYRDARPATALFHGPFVRVGGALVAYRAWGRTGSPIVLLGGAAEPSWVWHDVGPLLAARGHRVLAVDLPPFGYTQRHGPYTLAGWLALLNGFEHRLHVTRPLLVGHSLGAGVAAAEALQHPRRVSGIVLLDGDVLPFGGGRSFLAHLLVYPWFPAAVKVASGSDWFVGRILRNAWGPHPPPFPHATLQQFEQPFRVAGTAAALRQLVSHGLPGVTASQLHEIRFPRAVIWGVDDDVDSVASGRATAAALGVPLRTVARAGHLSMLAQPRRVAALIAAGAAGRG